MYDFCDVLSNKLYISHWKCRIRGATLCRILRVYNWLIFPQQLGDVEWYCWRSFVTLSHNNKIQKDLLCNIQYKHIFVFIKCNALNTCLIISRWRHQMETFSALLALCAGNSPVNSPQKGQWRGALIFSLNCARTNGWVHNRDTGDLTRHCAHYIVTVMYPVFSQTRRVKRLGPFPTPFLPSSNVWSMKRIVVRT